MRSNFLLLTAFVSLVACGDSGTGGSNPGGGNAGGSNAGGSSAGGEAPTDPCVAAAQPIIEKIDSCDLQPVGGGSEGGGNVGGGNEGGAPPDECTAEDVAQIECIAPCYDAAPCTALDGTDVDAQSAFFDCVVACS
jgi:hypothetical protein